MLKRCPHCNLFYNVMPGIGDYVHDCNPGNAVLGYDDMLHLSGPGWNYRGIADGASPAARVVGEDEGNTTRRGNDADTTRIVDHEEYIEL